MAVLAYLFFVPFTDVIEKYLMEFDFLSPFLIIMIEAIFGFTLVSIYSAGKNPFKDLIILYEESSTKNFILLIFLLFLYFALSAGVNVYKILTIGLYSPMAKTLAVYILNPFIYIYYFVIENDFLSQGERNWFYFIINVIIALIISFFGCVFNEFLVLTFCGLEYETHFYVSNNGEYALNYDEDDETNISNDSNNSNKK